MGSLTDICEESLNERLLDKGYRNYCGALIKKRNVSFIRDFPLGCGRNAPYMHVPLHDVNEEIGADIKTENVAVNDCVKTSEVGNAFRDFPPGFRSNAPYMHVPLHDVKKETGADIKTENVAVRDCVKASEVGNALLLHNLVKIPLKQESTNSLNDFVVKVVNIAVKKSEVETENKTSLETDKKRSPPPCYSDIADNLKENASEIRYPTKRVLMIREYPPFCGRNAPRPTEEEWFKLVQGSKTSKRRDTAELEERRSPPQGGRKSIKEVNGGAQDVYSKKIKVVGKDTSLQLKTNLVKDSHVRGRANEHVKKNLIASRNVSHKNKGARVIKLKGNAGKSRKYSPAVDDILDDFQVIVPSFGPSSSGDGVIRNEVRETLRLFHAICRKLMQGEEAKMRLTGRISKRIDILSSNLIKELGKEVNKDKQRIGPVPGVEVGDEYQYRVELALVGVHRLYQSGIDYTKHGNRIVATSIVSSGGYADDEDFGDVLIYTGQGGNVVVQKDKSKQPEDQKLVRGNLALKNSISARTPVRVIRGYKETKISSTGKHKLVTSYTYDGLYTVERYWQEVGSHGKLVFMFELKRNVDQPEVAWREVKKKGKLREGLCDDDISRGKEILPVSAINTYDDEKPPKFNYITRMKYPDWCCPTPPKGCDCVRQCGNSQNCSCISKNGDFPYTRDGAIVEVKPLVYECGPSCKCPPSCYNKVSQHGMKIKLEIFKTGSRGWGVRSLTSIPSGTFICEYLGKLIKDEEAEKRENDEYLFDIGQNYNDCSVVSTLKPEQLGSDDESENNGFTIDAAESGNVGRFINHSCSPNLYAQNVLYDHEDKRMPHIMLFAADNIPPLQELTYHYNYAVNQIHDPNGNIRTKNCYCDSEVCTGRMY